MTDKSAERFPWQSLFRAAMLQGLSPDRIWQMTAGELHALLQARAATGPALPADELQALVATAADETADEAAA